MNKITFKLNYQKSSPSDDFFRCPFPLPGLYYCLLNLDVLLVYGLSSSSKQESKVSLFTKFLVVYLLFTVPYLTPPLLSGYDVDSSHFIELSNLDFVRYFPKGGVPPNVLFFSKGMAPVFPL